MSKIIIKNDTAPDTPDSGKTALFIDSTSKLLKTVDDAGVETEYGAVGAGAGDIVGPASSTDDNVAFFDGVTGKLLKDSGLTLSGSNTGDQTTVSGNSGDTDALKSATTTVNVSSATAPTTGQVLTATSSTAATWQAAAAGSGNVAGPVSSVADNVALFNGTTGKIIKDSGLALSGSNTGDQTTVSGNSGSTNALESATTTVNVSSATAPSTGQYLIATGSTAATWQTPAVAGDTFSAATSVDQSIARYNGTNNKTVEDSKVLIDDDGRISQTGLGNSTYLGVSAGTVEDMATRNNIGIGYQALLVASSTANSIAIGNGALKSATGGGLAIAIGNDAGKSVSTGFWNTLIGYHTGQLINTGAGNTYLGGNVGVGNRTGSNNTILGYNSANAGAGDYSNMTIVGTDNARNMTGGTGCIILGYNIDAPTATVSDYLNIGGMITADMATDVVDLANISLTNLPVYADEAAAVIGSLATDRVYMTSTGELRIKL